MVDLDAERILLHRRLKALEDRIQDIELGRIEREIHLLKQLVLKLIELVESLPGQGARPAAITDLRAQLNL